MHSSGVHEIIVFLIFYYIYIIVFLIFYYIYIIVFFNFLLLFYPPEIKI